MDQFFRILKCFMAGAMLGFFGTHCALKVMASDWPPGCLTREECQEEARELCVSGQTEWCIIIPGTDEDDEEDEDERE